LPPNIQRFLPVIVIAVFLLIILPTLVKKHGTSGPNAATRSTQTIGAMNLIDKGEKAYLASHGHFTSHLADLIASSHGLAADLAIGLDAQVDVSSDGKTFLAQVSSDVLGLVRARDGGKILAQSCLVLKSGSGVACPAASR
jgi:competence protein ComGC